jgi:hypothetical protein
MLRWCRLPAGLELVRKIARTARVTVPGLSPANGTSPLTRESWLAGQLIDANVRRALIVGAVAGEATDWVRQLQSAAGSIEIVCGTNPAGFDCIVIRKGALFAGLGIEAVSTARMVIVCETESFDGYRIVSDVLSRSQWELIRAGADAGDGYVVLRRMDECPSRGAWDILDVLHRTETT